MYEAVVLKLCCISTSNLKRPSLLLPLNLLILLSLLCVQMCVVCSSVSVQASKKKQESKEKIKVFAWSCSALFSWDRLSDPEIDYPAFPAVFLFPPPSVVLWFWVCLAFSDGCWGFEPRPLCLLSKSSYVSHRLSQLLICFFLKVIHTLFVITY